MVEDYSTYRFTIKEGIIYFCQGAILVIIIGLLFYQSLIGILILSPMIAIYLRRKRSQLIEKRRWQLNLEFRDGITSLSAALNAGYSPENAFDEALDDLRHLYEESSLIIKEFTYLSNQIRMNVAVEKALIDLGERTGVEDIISFAQVFVTAKRSGGDLIRVIKMTCNTISDKIEVKRSIITLITEKKLEANIMKVIPIAMLLYLHLFTPGFLEPLYHNLFGYAVMTVLLGAYLIAVLLTDRIMLIEV